jgi:hypothetical protein
MPFARSNGALDGWMTHPGLQPCTLLHSYWQE